MMSTATAAVTLAWVLLSASAPAEQGTGAPYNLRLEPHEFKGSAGQTVAAERGWITVPANRGRPESGTLDLAFVRFKSTAGQPGSPIVYLAGGPGGSGIAAARGTRLPLFLALREVCDVIAFDQRGTGVSKPFNLCPERVEIALDRPTDPEAVMKELRAQVRACAARLREHGVDLEGFTTAESADDLDALRQALGAEKISLWGISYGTHLALATLRRHGEHVDRVILAGIEGPDHTLKPPSQQQALLERIAELVREDPKVGPAVPDLMALMKRVLDRLEGEPVRVRLTHPVSGKKRVVVAAAWDLRFATAQMLRGPSSFAGLPDLYWRIDHGDAPALALLRAQNSVVPVGRAMSSVMDCASGATKARLARIAEEARQTLLADVINLPHPGVCEAWGAPDLGDEFRSPVRSEVPALFISGTLDGRTPPENAEEVMQGFPNATHLIIDGAGHSDPLFLSSPKILEAMLTFMKDRPLSTTRIELEPPPFVEPRQPIELERTVLERYVGTYRVDKSEVRKVLLAGDQLYTKRGTGPVLPIRPFSETQFFYEGSGATAEFHLDAEGRVTHMTVVQGGSSGRADKID